MQKFLEGVQYGGGIFSLIIAIAAVIYIFHKCYQAVDDFSDKHRIRIKTRFDSFPKISEGAFKRFEEQVNCANHNGGGVYRARDNVVRAIVKGDEVSLSDLKRQLQGHSYIGLAEFQNDATTLEAIDLIKNREKELEDKRLHQISLEKQINEQDITGVQIKIAYFSMIAAALSATTSVCMVVIELLRANN